MVRSRAHLVAAVALAAILADATRSATGAEEAIVWRTHIRRGAELLRSTPLAVDAAGNVLVAGNTRRVFRMTLAKLRGANGAIRWRRTILGRAFAIAVDRRGDPIVAGQGGREFDGFDFSVLKRDAKHGRLLWRRDINGTAHTQSEIYVGSLDGATGVALDADENVIAAGRTENQSTGFDLTVVKLTASDGAELWRRVVDGTVTSDTNAARSGDAGQAVAVDDAGDVLVAGYVGAGFVGGGDLVVMKLARADGREVWRRQLTTSNGGFNGANALTVTGTGDVVVAGYTGDGEGPVATQFTVFMLARTDGSMLWRSVPDGLGTLDEARAVALDETGNIIAAGMTRSGDVSTFTVVKFARTTGQSLWRTDVVLPGYGGAANAVGVNRLGMVAAAGYATRGTPGQGALGTDLVIAWLAGDTGAELSRLTHGNAWGADAADAVVQERDGTFVVSGTFDGRFSAARLLPPGAAPNSRSPHSPEPSPFSSAGLPTLP